MNPKDVCECDHFREDHPVTYCDGCCGCDDFRLRTAAHPGGDDER